MHARTRLFAMALLVVVAGPRPLPAVEPTPDKAAAKAAFDKASAELRTLFAEMSVLQSRYHLPDADKAAIEATYGDVATRAQAAGNRLEEAAIALAIVDPSATEARQISGAAVAGAMKADAPEVALEKAATLDAAGVAGADTLMAATVAAPRAR